MVNPADDPPARWTPLHTTPVPGLPAATHEGYAEVEEETAAGRAVRRVRLLKLDDGRIVRPVRQQEGGAR